MMEKVILERHDFSNQGTFGKIYFMGHTLFTGELPWENNKPNVSCIPTGTYYCNYTYSLRFRRETYILVNVVGRSGIRIHPANLMGSARDNLRCQLNGCIALGKRVGWMNGQKALFLSAPSVHEFEKVMGHKPFFLEIKNAEKKVELL